MEPELPETRTICTDGVKPPPWVDEAFDDDEADALTEAFFDQLAILGPAMNHRVTDDQLDILIAVFSMGASYGWDRAMTHGPMAQRHANAGAVAARKKAKAETRSKVRAAWAEVEKSGQVPDVDSIAEKCAVSRATVYRAMQDE